MSCLASFLLRATLHAVELRSTFCNALQQLAMSLHPSSNFPRNFWDTFSMSACAISHFALFLILNLAPSLLRPKIVAGENCTMCNSALTCRNEARVNIRKCTSIKKVGVRDKAKTNWFLQLGLMYKERKWTLYDNYVCEFLRTGFCS